VLPEPLEPDCWGERWMLASLLHSSKPTDSRWQLHTKLYVSTGVRIDSILSLVAMARTLPGTRAGEDANKTEPAAPVNFCPSEKFRKNFWHSRKLIPRRLLGLAPYI
jgi:hypothetical protein